MTVPTASDFLERFPEFGELATEVIEGSLSEAGRSCDTNTWGSIHTEAVSQLAAHLLATRQMQIGIQVGAPSGTPSGLAADATLYGQEYKRLLGTLPLCGFAL
jgi:hypothetical protein